MAEGGRGRPDSEIAPIEQEEAEGASKAGWVNAEAVSKAEDPDLGIEAAQAALRDVQLPELSPENFPQLANVPKLQEELGGMVARNLQEEDIHQLQDLRDGFQSQRETLEEKYASGPGFSGYLSAFLTQLGGMGDPIEGDLDSKHQAEFDEEATQLYKGYVQQLLETKLLSTLNKIIEERQVKNAPQAKILHEILRRFLKELGIPSEYVGSILPEKQEALRALADTEEHGVAPTLSFSTVIIAPELSAGDVPEIDTSRRALDALADRLNPAGIDASKTGIVAWDEFIKDQAVHDAAAQNSRNSLESDLEAFAAAGARFEELKTNTKSSRKASVETQLSKFKEEMDDLNFRMAQARLAMLEAEASWMRANQLRAQAILPQIVSKETLHKKLQNYIQTIDAQLAPIRGSNDAPGQLSILRAQVTGIQVDPKKKSVATKTNSVGFEATLLQSHLDKALSERERGGVARNTTELVELRRQDDTITRAMKDMILHREGDHAHVQKALDDALKGNDVVRRNINAARQLIDSIDQAIEKAARRESSEADALLDRLKDLPIYAELQTALDTMHRLSGAAEDSEARQKAMSIARAVLFSTLRSPTRQDIHEASNLESTKGSFMARTLRALARGEDDFGAALNKQLSVIHTLDASEVDAEAKGLKAALDVAMAMLAVNAQKINQADVFSHKLSQFETLEKALIDDVQKNSKVRVGIAKIISPRVHHQKEDGGILFKTPARGKLKTPKISVKESAHQFENRRLDALKSAIFPPSDGVLSLQAQAVKYYLGQHPEVDSAIKLILSGKDLSTVNQRDLIAASELFPPENDAFFTWHVRDTSKLPSFEGVHEVEQSLEEFSSLQQATGTLFVQYRADLQNSAASHVLKPDDLTARVMDIAFGDGDAAQKQLALRLQGYNRQFKESLRLWDKWNNKQVDHHLQKLHRAIGRVDEGKDPASRAKLDQLVDSLRYVRSEIQERKDLISQYAKLAKYQEKVIYLEGLTKRNESLSKEFFAAEAQASLFDAYLNAGASQKDSALGALKTAGLIDSRSKPSDIEHKAKIASSQVEISSAKRKLVADVFKQIAAELEATNIDPKQDFPAIGTLENAAQDFLGSTGIRGGELVDADLLSAFGIGELGKKYLSFLSSDKPSLLASYGRSEIGQLVASFQLSGARGGITNLSGAYGALFARLKKSGGLSSLVQMLSGLTKLPAAIREHPRAARDMVQNMAHAMAIVQGSGELGTLTPILSAIAARSHLPEPDTNLDHAEEKALPPEFFALLHFANLAPLIFNIAKNINEGSTAGNLIRKLNMGPITGIAGIVLDVASATAITSVQRYAISNLDDDSDIYIDMLRKTANGQKLIDTALDSSLVSVRRASIRSILSGKVDWINPMNYIRFALSEAGEKISWIKTKIALRFAIELGVPSVASVMAVFPFVKGAFTLVLGAAAANPIGIAVSVVAGLLIFFLLHKGNSMLLFRSSHQAYEGWIKKQHSASVMVSQTTFEHLLMSEQAVRMFPKRST